MHIKCIVHNMDPVLLANIDRELTLLSRHFMKARAHGAELDKSAYLLLGRLEAGEPLTLKELAELFRLDISTVNRQMAALHKHGLVERIADPEGGLARRFAPTQLGLEKLVHDRRISEAGVGQVVEDWSEAEQAQLHGLLIKFNQSVERMEGQPWPRPHE